MNTSRRQGRRVGFLWVQRLGALVGAASWGASALAAPPCAERITRGTVVACALEASLGTRAEQIGLEGLAGRRTTASVVLPTNPVVTVTGGVPTERGEGGKREALWGATLSQELEVAGQRGARLDVVSAEQRAQRGRILAAQRDAAAAALHAYFDVLAAQEAWRLAERVAEVATSLTTLARAQAQLGLTAKADASVAEAAAVQLLQNRLVAQQRAKTATATLATLLGHDPLRATTLVDGELQPLRVAEASPSVLVNGAIARRADVTIALAERQAQQRRASLFEKLRVPNPTVSVYATNDWVNERRVGLGLALPLPLPAPLGRTYAGNIAEAKSLTRRADTDVEQLQRTVRLEVIRALETLRSAREQAELYDPERIRQAEATVRSIAEELATRRLPVREGLVMQRTLLEMLFGYVEARRQLCFASVELARVAGLPLGEGGR